MRRITFLFDTQNTWAHSSTSLLTNPYDCRLLLENIIRFNYERIYGVINGSLDRGPSECHAQSNSLWTRLLLHPAHCDLE